MKLKKRLLPFLLAIAIILNMFMPHMASLVLADETFISASEYITLVNNVSGQVTLSDGNISSVVVTSADALTYLSHTKPESYENATITIAAVLDTSVPVDEYSFVGLGRESAPFSGTIRNSAGTQYSITLTTPLFMCLSNEAEFEQFSTDSLTLIWQGTNSPLLAESFVFNTADSVDANWKLSFTNPADTDEVEHPFGGLVGTVSVSPSSNSQSTLSFDVDLSNDSTLGRNIKVQRNGDVGLLCGTLKDNAKIKLTSKTIIPTDSFSIKSLSTTGNAGGLVGSMESGCGIYADRIININNATITGGESASAGGIVGLSTDGLIVLKDSSNNSLQCNIKNSTINGAKNIGGLIGKCVYSGTIASAFGSASNPANSYFKTSNLTITTSSAGNCGGFFGMLSNGGKFNILSNGQTLCSNITLICGDWSTNEGGLIGLYAANNLSNTLTINGKNANANIAVSTLPGGTNNACNSYGGLIGLVESNSYVNAKDVGTSITTGAGPVTGAGIVAIANSGSVIDIETCKVNGSLYRGNNSSGGVIATMGIGSVLRLSGSLTLNLPAYESSRIYGQIVGTIDSSLVYATDGFVFNRYSGSSNLEIDDIGNYGELLRLDSTDLVEGASGLINFNSTTHSVTLNENSNLGSTSNIYSKKDFAALALTIQSNHIFYATSETVANLIGGNIVLQNDIDMTGTGIMGLLRDDGAQSSFTGSFNGNNKALTLNAGEYYGLKNGSATSGDGSGQIYRHQYIGLFAKLGNGASITNLVLNGNINAVPKLENTYIGGISGYGEVSGSLSLTNNTTNTVINYNSSTSCYVGGLVGSIYASTDSTVTGVGNTGNASITYLGTTSESSNIGGLIGVINDNENKLNANFSNSTITGYILSNTTGTITNFNVGGLIGQINPLTDSGVQTTILDLTNLSVINQRVIASSKTSTSGGLLGYSWQNTEAILTGVTVDGNSELTVGNGNFGGLVYNATGHWIIKSTESNESGISINNTTFNSTSTSGTSAFLVCHGEWNTNSNIPTSSRISSLYLELQDSSAYELGSSISVIDNSTYFDELVGYSIKSETDGASNQGIVSIETGNGIDNSNSCNTYKNQIVNKQNPNTRYYYNLSSLSLLNSNVISNAQEMLSWSVMQYASSNLTSYFGTTSSSYTVNGDIDLTGVSYYPVNNNASGNTGAIISINGTSSDYVYITFDNANIEALENENKLTSITQSQHNGMHCGLFRDVNQNIEVNYVNITGSVGKTYSRQGTGALISGTFSSGSGTTATKSLTLNHINLTNLYINSTSSYRPLLISNIATNASGGSSSPVGYATISLNDISVSYTDTNVFVNNYAASSLLGKIGSSNAQGIGLSFNEMVIDGAIATSPFSTATFLQSFSYAATSSGSYNFDLSEDWTGDDTNGWQHINNVTYGKELSNHSEDGSDSCRNSDEQFWYYDTDQYFVTPSGNSPLDGTSSSVNTAFSTGYLPYVAETYYDDVANINCNEIDINLKRGDLEIGCGTYSHPYTIENSKQLQSIADFINTGSSVGSSGWRVTYNSSKAFCKGNEANDKVYVANGSGSWTIENGTTTITDAQMLNYLKSAYYQIVNDIELSTKFTGIGQSNSEFSGVIIGVANEDGEYPTITIRTKNSGIKALGLIGTSYGSVIKDLSIKYVGSTTENDSTSSVRIDTSSANSTNTYFGGAIGYVLGGDNIIDNVSVTSPNITLNGTYSRIATIGGYVGTVEAGGIIFKNMNNSLGLASVTNGNSSDCISANSNYFYSNPYIGRVLDGFAFDVTNDTIDNTDKNYKIVSLNSTDKITYSSTGSSTSSGSVAFRGTVTTSTAQSLLVFSAIVNSGAGSGAGGNGSGAFASRSYFKGAVRNANYNNVGNASITSSDSDYQQAIADVANIGVGTGTPYLIKNYLDSSSKMLRTITGTYTRFSLIFGSNLDMSNYGSAFRGIGGRYYTSANINAADGARSFDRNLVYICGINNSSTSSSIKLNMNVNEYTNDKYQALGVGLITALMQDTGTSVNKTIQNIELSGNVSYNNYSESTGNTAATTSNVGVGAFSGITSGRSYANRNGFVANINNITLKDLNVSGSKYAGGIFGWSSNGSINGNPTYFPIKFTNCSYSGVTINADRYAGGFIGYLGSTSTPSLTVTNTSNQTLSGTISTNITENNSSIGGIVGVSEGVLNVCTGTSSKIILGTEENPLTLKKESTNYTTKTGIGFGGIVGLSKANVTANNITTSNLIINNINSDKNGGYASVIGIAKAQANASNIIVNSTNIATGYKASNGTGVGGVIGRAESTANVDSVAINDLSIKSSVNGNTSTSYGAGGLGGIIGFSASTTSINSCDVNGADITISSFEDGSTSTPSYYTGAGGLIGTTNASTTTISSSTVGSQSNKSVVIADKTSVATNNYCGGMIGINKSQLTISGSAIGVSGNKNVIVYEANSGAGGIIGTNTNSSTISSSTVNNIVVAGNYCGGVVGTASSPVTLTDSTVKSNSITNTNPSNTSSSSGGIVGSLTSNGTLSGSNILWNNNIVGCTSYSYNSETFINDMKNMSESSIGLKNSATSITNYTSCVFNCSANSTYSYGSIGTWVGNQNSSGNTVKLSGVSRQATMKSNGYYIPVRDVGNYNKTSYYGFIAYADYLGTASGTLMNTSGALSPYVTVNPKGEKISNEQLTGDGACFTNTSGSTTAIATQIINDYKNGANNSTLNNCYNSASVYSSSTALSSYKTEQTETLYSGNDFPLLVLEASAPADVTTQLTNYINLITNGAFSKAVATNDITYQNISVSTYSISSGSFSKNDSSSIYYSSTASTNKFRITSGQYDNGNDRFTLIKVSFGNGAYTVYAPVLVKQVVISTFKAAMLNDPTFISTPFDSTTSQILTEFGAKFTAYLSYNYKYSFMDYLQTGSSLDWSYDKTINVTSKSLTSNYLPSGTKLTLIDTQNNNKAYTNTLSSNAYQINLSSFKDTSGQSFAPTSFNDQLDLTAKLDSSVNQNNWVIDENGTVTASLNGDSTTFRLYNAETDSDKNTYSITTSKAPEEDSNRISITENYYLLVELPIVDSENGVSLTITSPTPTNQGLPLEQTQTYNSVSGNSHSNENVCFIYKPITQTLTNVSDSTGSHVSLNSTNNTVNMVLDNTVSIDKPYQEHLSVSDNRYMQFTLSLHQMLNNVSTVQTIPPTITGSVEFTITGEDTGTSVTVSYDDIKHETSSSLLVLPVSSSYENGTLYNLTSLLLSNTTVNVTANISLNLDTSAVNEFPSYTSEYISEITNSGELNSQAFWYFNPTASIANTETELSTGSKSNGVTNFTFYYEEVSSTTKLNYSVTDVSQLGINVNDLTNVGQPSAINTFGTYNVNSMIDYASEVKKANDLTCEIRLYKKNNNGEYQQITDKDQLENYISFSGINTSTGIVDKNLNSVSTSSDCYFLWKVNNTYSNNSNPFDLSYLSTDGTTRSVYNADSGTFNLPFNIFVNTDIEEVSGGGFYSNYMVELTVNLHDENQNVIDSANNSSHKDYIKYTFAKIATSVLR